LSEKYEDEVVETMIVLSGFYYRNVGLLKVMICDFLLPLLTRLQFKRGIGRDANVISFFADEFERVDTEKEYDYLSKRITEEVECDFNWLFHAIMMDNKYEIFADEGAEMVLKHICIDRLPENFIPTGLEIYPRETCFPIESIYRDSPRGKYQYQKMITAFDLMLSILKGRNVFCIYSDCENIKVIKEKISWYAFTSHQKDIGITCELDLDNYYLIYNHFISKFETFLNAVKNRTHEFNGWYFNPYSLISIFGLCKLDAHCRCDYMARAYIFGKLISVFDGEGECLVEFDKSQIDEHFERLNIV
jgi:hypothetical protein